MSTKGNGRRMGRRRWRRRPVPINTIGEFAPCHACGLPQVFNYCECGHVLGDHAANGACGAPGCQCRGFRVVANCPRCGADLIPF